MKEAAPTKRAKVVFWVAFAGAAWLLAVWLVSNASPVRNAAVKPLLSVGVSNDERKELSMITVDYLPGESNPAHIHRAQALAYVLEGSIVMQVRGGPPVTLTPGQTFYEGPDDVHIVSRNASDTAPAKFLVFLVKEKGAPILRPVE